MKSRELNKLKKERENILRKNYTTLSDDMRNKLWSRLENIDREINKLKLK